MFHLFNKFNLSSISLFIFLFLVSGSAFSSNEYFRSVASGNWNSNATWQMSTNSGGTWIAATSTPTDTSGIITIQSPNTVTVTVSVNADQLVVVSGGTIVINNGITLKILNGSGNDLQLDGGGTISGLGTLQAQGDVTFLIRTSSSFLSNIRFTTGTATSYCDNGSNIANYYGSMTVDTGTVFTTLGGGYTNRAYGNVTNNGTIAGNKFTMDGASFVNTHITAPTTLEFDSTTSLSGTGAYTGSSITIFSPGKVSLANNVTFTPSTNFIVNDGALFNPNTKTFTLNSGTFFLTNTATVSNSGIFQTQGTVSMVLRFGSNFNAPFKVNSGTTTSFSDNGANIANYYGTITIDTGSILTTPGGGYFNRAYGNVTNNGTIAGNAFIMRGSLLANNHIIAPTNMYFDSTTSLSGTGAYTGSGITINSPGIVSLANNVTFTPTSSFSVTDGGVFNPNSRTFTFNSGTFFLFNAATVSNSGIFQTQSNVSMILRTGSNFNAPLKVNPGITTAFNDNGGNIANYFNTVSVDAGAVLTTPGGGYNTRVYGNVTDNGTIAGNNFIMRGDVFANNGTVSSASFSFDTTVTLSGTGVWSAGNIYITGTGILNLANTLTFGAASPVFFRILPSGILNPNSFTAIFNGTISVVNFEIQNTASTLNSGIIQSKGNVTFNVKTGSNFNTPFNVATGASTIFNADGSNNAIFNRTITIDTGAVFQTPGGGYTCTANDSVTNNGTLTGPNTFVFFGPVIINNGVIGFTNFYFQSMITSPTSFHTLQGTGKFTSSNCQILEGANVTLKSNHQFSYLSVNTGSTFDMTSRTLKLFGTGTPITVNGSILTAGSTIEYNGDLVQNFPQAHINYANVRFNDTSGVTIVDNISLPGLIEVTNGKVNLNGFVVTLLITATLSETPGHTFTGNAGYLVTTRDLSAPNNLNVGGLGAQISSTANLGLTEIKRGHNVQLLPSGNQAIKRWYSIKPLNNSDLNATLIFNYDVSELNGNTESKLNLFKSTNAGVNYSSNGGTVNTVLHQITQNNISTFGRFTAGSALGVSFIMEAFYNPATNNLNRSDTVRGYLRRTFAPYAIVDSAKTILDSLTFRAPFNFTHALTGTYYLQLKHRNSLETWSSSGVPFVQDSILSYDFTFSASQAYESNQVLKGGKYCIYSGDVDQNGSIDLTDVILVLNASSVFTTGYVNTDVNGNGIVDLTDVLVAFNNSNKFITRKTPLNP